MPIQAIEALRQGHQARWRALVGALGLEKQLLAAKAEARQVAGALGELAELSGSNGAAEALRYAAELLETLGEVLPARLGQPQPPVVLGRQILEQAWRLYQLAKPTAEASDAITSIEHLVCQVWKTPTALVFYPEALRELEAECRRDARIQEDEDDE
jgi:hypothetical protein